MEIQNGKNYWEERERIHYFFGVLQEGFSEYIFIFFLVDPSVLDTFFLLSLPISKLFVM